MNPGSVGEICGREIWYHLKYPMLERCLSAMTHLSPFNKSVTGIKDFAADLLTKMLRGTLVLKPVLSPFLKLSRLSNYRNWTLCAKPRDSRYIL